MLSLLVDDYDTAIDYYTRAFGFSLVEDTAMGPDGKRWVVVKPGGSAGTNLLLARAKNEQEKAAIGNQTGGRVFLFLDTTDFWSDYEHYKKYGVDIAREPSEEAYGTVCVLRDRYGNLWDLVQRQ